MERGEHATTRSEVFAALALGAASVAAWGAVVGGTFQDDDLVGPLGLAGGWRIRPFLRLTFSLQEALHGHRADLLLAGNLALLLVTALGVWSLAVRRLGATAALLAGVAFLLQPAHAEVVAYVSGRSMGLMTALGVWCIRAHLEAVRADGPDARRAWTALSLLLLVLASLSKEVALVVPVLAWIASRWDAPDRPSRVGPLLSGAAVLAVLLLLGFPRYRVLAGWSLAQHGPLSSLATYLAALPAQLSLWFRPGALCIVHAPGDGWVSPALGLLLVLAVAAAAWCLRHRTPTAAFAVGWALIALVPTHTLLARADVVTDRSLHLAWVGPAIGIGALLGRFVRTGRSPQVRVLLASAALAFVVLATRAVHRRVEVWSDPRALWTEAIRHSPGSARAWNNLGLVLLERDPREAARALRRAAELSPADPQLLSTLAVLETLCPTEGPCR